MISSKSNKIAVENIIRLTKLFKKKKWPVLNGDLDSDDSLFDRFCYLVTLQLTESLASGKGGMEPVAT
jgi:hypothetical protein